MENHLCTEDFTSGVLKLALKICWKLKFWVHIAMSHPKPLSAKILELSLEETWTLVPLVWLCCNHLRVSELLCNNNKTIKEQCLFSINSHLDHCMVVWKTGWSRIIHTRTSPETLYFFCIVLISPTTQFFKKIYDYIYLWGS